MEELHRHRPRGRHGAGLPGGADRQVAGVRGRRRSRCLRGVRRPPRRRRPAGRHARRGRGPPGIARRGPRRHRLLRRWRAAVRPRPAGGAGRGPARARPRCGPPAATATACSTWTPGAWPSARTLALRAWPDLPRPRIGAMSPRPEPLRAALAQINSTVGDLTGNAERIAASIDRARAEQAQLVVLPRAGPHRLPARGPAAQDPLPGGHRPTRSASWPRTPATWWPWSASPSPPGTSTTPPRCWPRAVWPGVYRKMHLPNYGVFDEQRYFQAGACPRHHRRERRHDRADHLRGHLDARAAGQHRGAGRRARDREPVGLALPRPQGHGARADARPARPRLPVGDAVLQPRRRPGRAGLRRPQPGPGPGGPRDRARAPVRGVADRLHHRPRRGDRRPAARHAPPGDVRSARAPASCRP